MDLFFDCGKPVAQPVIDSLSSFETPEGVVLDLRVAGPVVRALAWSIDALIRYGVLFVLIIVLDALGGLGVGLILLSFFLLEWFYPVLFEAMRGATPGKQAMGLAVVHDNGTPVSWSNALVRNLLRVVDILPGCYGFGLLAMLIHPQFKRIGDLAAGTLVIHIPKAQTRKALAKLAPLPLPFALNINEQRALLDFAERSNELSVQRQEELSAYLSDLPAKEARRLVLRYAQGLRRDH